MSKKSILCYIFFMIDLHTHSTASDGIYSPEDLVQKAQDRNIKVLALTDHDTIDGLKEAKKAFSALERYYSGTLCAEKIKEEIESSIMIQRMLSKAQEIFANNILSRF